MRRSVLLATMILVLLAPLAHGDEPWQLNFLLFDAAKKARTQEVIDLLGRGASVEARDRFGNTALLLAARTSRVKMLRALLEAGSAIDHRNLKGSTALLRATTAGHGRTAKALIEAGFDFAERHRVAARSDGASPGRAPATGRAAIKTAIYCARKMSMV